MHGDRQHNSGPEISHRFVADKLAFPLGGYYLAYLKVHHNSPEAVITVRRQLEALYSALREGCAGQLPEIYDGADPVLSKGCFAQAWSVGELLRVYEKLEQIEQEGEAHAG